MSYIDRKDLISLARISSELGLHSDVIDSMKQIIEMSTPLSYDERNLLFSSYHCMRDHFFKLRRKVKRMKPFVQTFNKPSSVDRNLFTFTIYKKSLL